MPTLSDQIAAAKSLREQVEARLRKLGARASKQNRKDVVRMKIILGAAAIAAGKTDECLGHVSADDRAFVLRILEANYAAPSKDESQQPPTP